MILIHQTTNHQLISLKQSLPHAILIHGPKGSGKKNLMDDFANSTLGEIKNNPNYTVIVPDEGKIGIEQVRKISDLLKRKSLGSSSIRRIVGINDSHLLTEEAQNALLKTLEEPPKDTILILATDDPTKLMRTIRSRTQQLIVLPVSLSLTIDFYKNSGYSLEEIKSAYYMGDGRPEMINAILNNSTEHKIVDAITKAKEVLKKSRYHKLLELDSLLKDKDNLDLFLLGLERIIISGLRISAEKNLANEVLKLYKISVFIEKSKKSLKLHGNLKLNLTELFINL